VTPQISADGRIQLGIEPLITSLVGTETSRNGSTAPIVDVKQSSSMATLRDRETVRLSGLIQESNSRSERRVPLLGDIPFLGALFRWSYQKTTHRELVIFVTPRILD
jgi:type II secretory pathway component GspD/PulD (secretin)